MLHFVKQNANIFMFPPINSITNSYGDIWEIIWGTKWLATVTVLPLFFHVIIFSWSPPFPFPWPFCTQINLYLFGVSLTFLNFHHYRFWGHLILEVFLPWNYAPTLVNLVVYATASMYIEYLKYS